MSFSASAKRATDRTRPIGLRASCLNECLEQFNLFGYQATRIRLRAMLGVEESGWTDAQLMSAVELLRTAKASWSSFSTAAFEHQRQLKGDQPRPKPQNHSAVFVAWSEEYLRGDNASTWIVASLGNCDQCGHPMIHHGGHGCAVCGIDPNVQRTDRCRVPLPGPPTTLGHHTQG